MRKRRRSLALQLQQRLTGDLYVFRGRCGDLGKILWHDGIGIGMSISAKRLERGKYVWPSAVDGVIAIFCLAL